MEIHQVRYFLALSRSLNFTRAAEECNVTQPALSRGIIQLEAELGGDLVRREGKLTHLTNLGQTVLPALQQCYDASKRAKSLADSFLKEGHAPLYVAMSRSIEMALLSPVFSEMTKAFPKIEIRITRGPGHEISEKLKSGAAEIAIAGPLEEEWDRLNARRLYEQHYGVLVGHDHHLARAFTIDLDALQGQRLLACPNCTMTDRLTDAIRMSSSAEIVRHEIPHIDDLAGLVHAGFGIGVVPFERHIAQDLRVVGINGLDLTRWIHAITVAGRPQSPAAATLVNLLRVRHWPVSEVTRGRAAAVLQ